MKYWLAIVPEVCQSAYTQADSYRRSSMASELAQVNIQYVPITRPGLHVMSASASSSCLSQMRRLIDDKLLHACSSPSDAWAASRTLSEPSPLPRLHPAIPALHPARCVPAELLHPHHQLPIPDLTTHFNVLSCRTQVVSWGFRASSVGGA